MNPIEPFAHSPRVAYFSMEIALQDEIPTYSGGLGVLAGDTLRSAADLELPLVGVTLVSRAGYFKQQLDAEGNQTELPDPWDPARWATPLLARVAVAIEDRTVWIQAWLYVLQGGTSGAIPVILLDTDLDTNSAADREITHTLYGDGPTYRLKQEVVLGIGGLRMLQALGLTIHTYHMNEGHSAFLALELLVRNERAPTDLRAGESPYDLARVREQCIFTTHTPVEAGHDQFGYDLVKQVLTDTVDVEELKKLAGPSRLNMTRLALSLSGYVNGVAKRHAEVSSHLFPGYRVHAITNGVHPRRWTSESFAALYDRHLPNWQHEPEILVRADQMADDEVWSAHQAAKQALIDFVQKQSGVALSLNAPIIGFARRMTSYKRPELLLSDPQRLRKLNGEFPLQIVMAGKAHPKDEPGKDLIRFIHQRIHELRDALRIVFLPDYRLSSALFMVSGADVWLNTPLRPLEASGTSGMKAAFNGVINLSVLDGWWLEGHIEGVTGWSVGSSSSFDANGDDANALFEKLEQHVLPTYYRNRARWVSIMKGAIAKNAYYFNSHRMMRRYTTEAYLR
jgi:starch phosphorylase